MKDMPAELPLVSVIMPAYNAEKYLTAAIQSVLDQTFEKWELLVIDDGSIDRTAEIARKFSDADKRIRYIFQSNNRQASARNTGIKKARADFIAFLDADDLWTSEKLELQIRKAKETAADIIFSDGFVFPEDDAANESRLFSTLHGKFDGAKMFPLLFIENRLPILSVMARRNVLCEIGLFNEDPRFHGCEDYELWLRLAKAGAIFYGMQEKLVRYRVHAASTSSKKIEWLEAKLALLQMHSEDESLSTVDVSKRFRGVYRALVAASIERGDIRRAKEYARLCACWEPHESFVLFHLALIKFLPSEYERVTERLYKIGGALKRSSATLTGRRSISLV